MSLDAAKIETPVKEAPSAFGAEGGLLEVLRQESAPGGVLPIVRGYRLLNPSATQTANPPDATQVPRKRRRRKSDTPPLSFGDSRLAAALRDMPPLRHWVDREKPFDWKDSEVAQWILRHPETIRYLFERANQSRAIVYDKETTTWMGANTMTASGKPIPKRQPRKPRKPRQNHGYTIRPATNPEPR